MLSRLKWLTFLSLDAPLVAIAWQALFARETRTVLAGHHTLIVFLSVWLGYAADRWFDNLKRKRPNSEQHQFYAKHFRAIPTIWILVLASAVALAFTHLTRSELAHGFVLMGFSLAYTLFAQKARKLAAYPFLKSLFTALLVLASSLLFLPPDSLSLLSVACVGILFTSNCLFIRSWTHDGKAQHALLLALANAALSVFAIWTLSSSAAIAAIASQVTILALHLSRNKTNTPTLRTAADLCLLSPWLMLLF